MSLWGSQLEDWPVKRSSKCLAPFDMRNKASSVNCDLVPGFTLMTYITSNKLHQTAVNKEKMWKETKQKATLCAENTGKQLYVPSEAG